MVCLPFVLDESRNQFWSPEAREAGDPGVLTREPVYPETSDMKAAPAMGFFLSVSGWKGISPPSRLDGSVFSWELKIHRVLVLPVVWALIVAAYSSVQLLSLCVSWEELRRAEKGGPCDPFHCGCFRALTLPRYTRPAHVLGDARCKPPCHFHGLCAPSFHLVNS